MFQPLQTPAFAYSSRAHQPDLVLPVCVRAPLELLEPMYPEQRALMKLNVTLGTSFKLVTNGPGV